MRAPPSRHCGLPVSSSNEIHPTVNSRFVAFTDGTGVGPGPGSGTGSGPGSGMGSGPGSGCPLGSTIGKLLRFEF